jgi:hypothetical protein
MENETLGENEIREVKIDLANLKIGEDKPMILPKQVEVIEIETENVKFEKNENTKVKFMVKHPDTNELLEISKVSYIISKKVKTSGIWLKLDNDGNIPFKSALAEIMRYKQVLSILDLKNMVFYTETDENGYLVLKAY